MAAAASDRQDVQEEAAQPADGLRLGLLAAAAVLDAHVGDLRAGDGVAGLDQQRVDLAGEAQHVDVAVDADLLLAGDQQVAVGQHVGDEHGDGAEEVVAVLGGALAGEAVAAGAFGAGRDSADGLMPASAVTLASTLPLLSIELVDFWLATIFSTICTVSVSPTRRAR